MAQFTNQAQLSYNNATINSNIAVGEILEILSADKIAVTTTYNAGGDVTYVISAVNSGTTPVGGISVTDNLGAYPFGEETLYPLTYKDGSVRLYINGVLQAAPTTVAGPPLVISGITLPANSNMVLVYEATVNSFAPLGEGTLDFEKIIAKMQTLGVEYYLVEQDNAALLPNTLEQVEKSIKYLQTM